MVTLTENAASEIRRQLSGLESGPESVRIGVTEGGCAGTKYVVQPGAAKVGGDVVFAQQGLAVLCDRTVLDLIDGLRIDFVKALMGGGFKFENPNAGRTCGCGASFRLPESD